MKDMQGENVNEGRSVGETERMGMEVKCVNYNMNRS